MRTAHARNLDFREGEFDFLGGSARAHTYLVLRMRKRPYTHEPDKLRHIQSMSSETSYNTHRPTEAIAEEGG